MLSLLTLCVLFHTLLNQICCGDSKRVNRAKRVIAGTSVLDLNSEYGSVRYVVWVADGHSCDSKSLALNSCSPNTDNAICSGSLLTSTIVQTVCHCIVIFEGKKDGFEKSVTLQVWESMYDIFAGAMPVEEAVGVKAKNYISHPKCSQHSKTGRILYDYGVIVLRSPLAAKAIKHAPVYTILTLERMWTDMMAQQIVCMELGFGKYRLLSTNQPEAVKSRFLRHGWVRMMDYIWCHSRTSLPLTETEGLWNYSQDATWFCTKMLYGRGQHQAEGDSGSPTTCGNQYVGMVASSTYSSITWQFYFSISMSTAFSVFENSAEYRQALILAVNAYDKIDPKATTSAFNYRPAYPPINQYFYDKL